MSVDLFPQSSRKLSLISNQPRGFRLHRRFFPSSIQPSVRALANSPDWRDHGRNFPHLFSAEGVLEGRRSERMRPNCLNGGLIRARRSSRVEKKGRWSGKKKRKTMLQEKKEHNSEIHGFKKGRKKVCTFLCGGQWIGCSLLLRWFSLSLSPDAHTHILHTHRFCVRCYKERQLAFQPGSTGYVWWSNKLYNLFFFFPPSCRLPFVKQALV